jgi:hypothetical protein
MSKVDSLVNDLFKDQPIDLIEFLYKENWITLSSIGSIFTFSLVGSFRVNIFDKLMGYILPIESFNYMKVSLPDIGESPDIISASPNNPLCTIVSDDPNEINFGGFVRESIIWIFMIMLLYIIAIFVRWPDSGGITFNTSN